MSSAVTVCSRPPSSQFQRSCWPTFTWTSFGLKAMPLIVTGPAPLAGTVELEMLTSPPLSLLHPAPDEPDGEEQHGGNREAAHDNGV